MRPLPVQWPCMRPFAKDMAIKKIKNAGLACIGAFKEALFPLNCLMCGRFFHVHHRENLQCKETVSIGSLLESDAERMFQELMGPYLCRSCVEQFVPVKSPLCEACGFMFKSREGEDHVCEACIRSKRLFGIARASGIYDKALMAVIHSFKYGEKVQLSHPLSVLLLATFLYYWKHRSIDLIVPVPLNKKRFRKRGFNQAYLLIKDWETIMRRVDFPMQYVKINRHVLERTRATLPQTGLGRKDRMSNVKKAFALSMPEAVKDRRVLVIDDVYTTGATVSECARVLLKGGATEVDILTLARTM
jgi:ComF family protein